jgi:ribose transport system permease protein
MQQRVGTLGRNGLVVGRVLQVVGPAYAAILVLLIVGHFISASFDTPDHLATLLVLASFVIVAGFGQGIVILTGGLDLSIPWTITFSGVVLSLLSQGSDRAATWVIPVVLLLCVGVGLFNGLGIVLLGISPVVMTLATNAMLQGVVLVLTNGTPTGSAPPSLGELMNGRFLGSVPILIPPLLLFVVAGVLLLQRTSYGRQVYAVGNSPLVARLSGIRVGLILISVYVISALCSGLAGLMLTGYGRQSYLGMGDQYLLPSIAAVVVGGASALGGRGYYLGTVGGAILLAALGTILAGLTLPDAIKEIVFGLVVLLAVVANRERAL